MLLVVSVLLAPLAGCGVLGGADPEDAASAFLQALARGDAVAAASLTDDPAAATELIRQVRDELQPAGVRTTVGQTRTAENTATTTFTATWDLGMGRLWRYQGGFDLVRADTEAGWAVRWSPAALHPKLGGQQSVELRVERPVPASVMGRDGVPLLTAETVVPVVVDPAQLPAVAAPLAAALNQFDESITEQSIVQGAADAPHGRPYTAAVLREPDYQSVRDRIYELPGVTFPARQRLLAPDRDFASQVLPGVRNEMQERLAGSAGWRVVTVNSVGAEVATLAGRPPKPAPTVSTSLSGQVQAAAEDAVEPVAQPAMIVALQPSSGDVLAVAQNGPADTQGALALTGRYPPGSTFKIVTAASALQSGELKPQTPVDCPATTTIGGRVVPNIDEFELGTVPFRTAFARSCNTTFSQLAAGFEPGQLSETARQFGIGADYDIAGITTLTGEVPPAQDEIGRAANGFGQGQVLASPFGMAMVASTVAAGGQAPTPQLIRGIPTKVTKAPGQPLAPAAGDALPSMMRQVVTEGTATALNGLGDVHGKTGTAEYSATGAHGWFVGYRGDLAFAVLVVDAGASGPAVAAAERFLTAAGRE
ncbi:MAG: penicillin-binding protein [Pseudonocardiaceae bacterium]|nr:penicillin-binding protein [Pseudonocardiaceae bacterium]